MKQSDLDKVLANVSRDRRGFFDENAAGTGAAIAVLPLMTTQSMAQKEGDDPGAGGKCDDGLVVSKKTGKCAMPKKKKAD